jgi:hypothetical protein
MSILLCYFLVYIASSCISTIVKDDLVSPYILSIAVNITYLSSLMYAHFTPSLEQATSLMSLLIAYYTFDTQNLLMGKESLTHKLTFIPHHIVSVALIGGQLLKLYPLTLGMWFLTFFELSNFFLQFFQLANKKQWKTLRSIFAYPFVLTYIPFRGIIIPIYSLKFIPHILQLHPVLCVTYLGLFAFIDTFSVYFAVVVLYKWIARIRNNTSKIKS